MKEWKPAKWGLMILVMVCSASVQAQQTPQAEIHAFSLQQALDYAKQNNMQVKNALLDIQIQEQTNREFTGAAYPQISASGSLVYNAKLPVSLVPAEFFGGQPGTFEKLAFGVKWGATGGISLNQIVFDGQVFVGLQARKTLVQFQEKYAEVTEEIIRANVYKVYYQLVASKTQIELLDANIALLDKLQHDTRVMQENGFAEKLDLDKIIVQLANLHTEKVGALNQIRNGYLGLKVLIGMPVRDSLLLTDTLSDEKIKSGVLEIDDFNYEQRKDYQYANLGIALGEYDIRRYKLSKLPTLALNGYYNKNAQRNKFDFLGDGDWFDISAITLQLNIPIFTGFSANARIAKAKLALQQSINQRDALKINIDNEIETARNNFNTAITTLDYQKENMQLAETVFQQTKKKFEAGMGSNTEITQAQTDMKAAQTNYINALYSAIIARVDYEKATGKL
ncbi:TolC family protein [Agriterribacter sp.]|uniref:TolC family protein n=1 Tax=Agriterribacter sp. TaxID=2821509 RepID=UPI002C4261A2|nr:TolC family protein [Agriterribacter sp.]HRO46545.1 TolC family protein [Agriterribacter sp.]HRQ19006.1 TolC family protein [Agriterribacter sp.]